MLALYIEGLQRVIVPIAIGLLLQCEGIFEEAEMDAELRLLLKGDIAAQVVMVLDELQRLPAVAEPGVAEYAIEGVDHAVVEVLRLQLLEERLASEFDICSELKYLRVIVLVEADAVQVIRG